MNEKETGFKIICPFCNAPYTAEMEIDLEDSMDGCETCGPDPVELKIEINCSNCKKVIYTKEGKSYDF